MDYECNSNVKMKKNNRITFWMSAFMLKLMSIFHKIMGEGTILFIKRLPPTTYKKTMDIKHELNWNQL